VGRHDHALARRAAPGGSGAKAPWRLGLVGWD